MSLKQSSIEKRLQLRLMRHLFEFIPDDFVLEVSESEWQEIKELYKKRDRKLGKPVISGIPIVKKVVQSP